MQSFMIDLFSSEVSDYMKLNLKVNIRSDKEIQLVI